MSNNFDTTLSRHEAIAFEVVGQILNVYIRLADANGKNSTPDGTWTISGATGFLEVTSFPARDYMRSWAAKNREGVPYDHHGSTSIQYGELDKWTEGFLREEWAMKDVEKLATQGGGESHLYLHGREPGDREKLARASDTYACWAPEPMRDVKLPDGLDTLWLEGRSSRIEGSGSAFCVRVARFDRHRGWSRHTAICNESTLPAPPPEPGTEGRRQ